MTTSVPGVYVHDPDAVLDYEFDWKPLTHGTGVSDWLASGETIASYELLPSDGITVDSHTESDGKVTVWLSGAAPRRQTVTCRIHTNQGRTDDRTITLNVIER
ncbi:MAG: hypothetical protein J7518_17920 [Nocardioidaceae bacterium]|nr:hypothetical protein [Nocardioidaceae bacterium]